MIMIFVFFKKGEIRNIYNLPGTQEPYEKQTKRMGKFSYEVIVEIIYKGKTKTKKQVHNLKAH